MNQLSIIDRNCLTNLLDVENVAMSAFHPLRVCERVIHKF